LILAFTAPRPRAHAVQWPPQLEKCPWWTAKTAELVHPLAVEQPPPSKLTSKHEYPANPIASPGGGSQSIEPLLCWRTGSAMFPRWVVINLTACLCVGRKRQSSAGHDEDKE
jgi:hypothetical protein